MVCFDIVATEIVAGPGISIKMDCLSLDGPGRMFAGSKFDYVSGSSSLTSSWNSVAGTKSSAENLSGYRGFMPALLKHFSIVASMI